MEATTPKPFVFVLMPFSDDFNDVYQLGIKAACEEAETYCERVDEQIFEERILDRIYNQISKADLVVADMTGRNPNVFYEVGYAHALGKSVILLTSQADDIPFDLKHFSHIVYKQSISGLKKELRKKVKWFVDNPVTNKRSVSQSLRVFVSNQELLDGREIRTKNNSSNPDRSVTIYLEFNLKNETESVLQSLDFQLGIETPDAFAESLFSPAFRTKEELRWKSEAVEAATSFSHQTFNLGNKRILHLMDNSFKIVPGAWAKVFYYCHANKSNLTDNKSKRLRQLSIPMVLQTFSEKGSDRIDFSMFCVKM